jgi:hypothetical protein
VIVASRMALYSLRRRRLPTAGAIRITTCNAWYGLNSGRAPCRSPARAPLGRRPAPRRLPPRRNSSCWTCRLRVREDFADAMIHGYSCGRRLSIDWTQLIIIQHLYFGSDRRDRSKRTQSTTAVSIRVRDPDRRDPTNRTQGAPRSIVLRCSESSSGTPGDRRVACGQLVDLMTRASADQLRPGRGSQASSSCPQPGASSPCSL